MPAGRLSVRRRKECEGGRREKSSWPAASRRESEQLPGLGMRSEREMETELSAGLGERERRGVSGWEEGMVSCCEVSGMV